MKKIIASLLIVGACWGGHAITDQQIKDILTGLNAQGALGANLNPGTLAVRVGGVLQIPKTPQNTSWLAAIGTAVRNGDSIDRFLPEIRAQSTIPDAAAPVAAPRSAAVAAPTTAAEAIQGPESTSLVHPQHRSLVAEPSIRHKPATSTSQEQHLKEALLIGSDRQAVVGFDGISNRLQVFNPLYNQAFPNVPIIHQYNPLTSSGGGFFPLVVKIDSFGPILPEPVRAQLRPSPNCEIYWVVQDVSSINATGQGGGDNLVFRPHYWVHPGGQPVVFGADVQLLDPQGGYHHLPGTSYSIHDSVASPNAPTIPFQDQLKSRGGSLSFWSLTTYGQRNALTYHWILKGNDISNLEGIINKSATLETLLTDLHNKRAFFTNSKIIDEAEFIFGRI